MTQIRHDCDCATCSGGESTPGQYGGWTCACMCHRKKAVLPKWKPSSKLDDPHGECEKEIQQLRQQVESLNFKCAFMDKENKKAYEDLHIVSEIEKTLRSQFVALRKENEELKYDKEAVQALKETAFDLEKENDRLNQVESLFQHAQRELYELKAENEVLKGALKEMRAVLEKHHADRWLSDKYYPNTEFSDQTQKALQSTPHSSNHAKVEEAMERVIGRSREIAQADWQSDFAIGIINLKISLSELDLIREKEK